MSLWGTQDQHAFNYAQRIKLMNIFISVPRRELQVGACNVQQVSGIPTPVAAVPIYLLQRVPQSKLQVEVGNK